VLEFVVDPPHEGKLTVCYIQPETPDSRISHSVEPGVTYRRDVVGGQRYEIHVHLEYPGGHMESEPFIFTATTGKTTVTLRPDAPRDLHR
jgi:hypothetical protein